MCERVGDAGCDRGEGLELTTRDDEPTDWRDRGESLGCCGVVDRGVADDCAGSGESDGTIVGIGQERMAFGDDDRLSCGRAGCASPGRKKQYVDGAAEDRDEVPGDALEERLGCELVEVVIAVATEYVQHVGDGRDMGRCGHRAADGFRVRPW